MESKWVFWLSELGKEQYNLVGRKCANLGEMLNTGLPVPPGFALSLEAYELFLEKTNLLQEIHRNIQGCREKLSNIQELNNLSQVLRYLVESKEMPSEIEMTISSYYKELCKRCNEADIAVAVRSSGPVSHPGQYDTYLNVKGIDEILIKIRAVWASTFNPRALSFRMHRKLPVEKDPIGVAVLKMTKARCAGISVTADPITGDNSKIIVEANWGLGESIVSGEVTPDSWILNSETLEIHEKRKGTKKKAIVFKELGVAKQELPLSKSDIFCLKDEEVKEIAKLAKSLEQHFGEPQDIEWAIDEKGRLALLQTRPEVVVRRKDALDHVIDLGVERLFR